MMTRWVLAMAAGTTLLLATAASPLLAQRQPAAPQGGAPAGAAPGRGAAPALPPGAEALDYQYFKVRVQPIFLKKRPGNARCIVCHETGAPRLVALSPNATMWDEEQSQRNFQAWLRVVNPADPMASRLLKHPLAAEAGGDPFHAGGKHWTSQSDPEFQTLLSWIKGAKL